MVMKQRKDRLPLETIIHNVDNPRTLASESDITDLQSGDKSLAEHGLLSPLVVRLLPNGLYETGKGNRRLKGLNWLATYVPEAFEKHFSKGIPVIVIENATEAEWADLVTDHAEQRGLTDKFEFIAAVVLLILAGITEKTIIGKMWVFFCQFGNKNPESLAEIRLLESKGKYIEALNKKKDTCHGTYQQCLRYADCSPVCLNTYRAAKNGTSLADIMTIPAWYAAIDDGSTIWPAHKNAVMVDLDAARRKDDKIIDEYGIKKYNRHNPGPCFIAKLKEYIKAAQEAIDGESGDQPIREKALPAKELKELAGNCRSEIVKTILKIAAGVADKGALDAIDVQCLNYELAISYNRSIETIGSEVENALECNLLGLIDYEANAYAHFLSQVNNPTETVEQLV